MGARTGLRRNPKWMARPTWSFDFRSEAIPAGSTFARASVGTYFNSAGVLASAGSNAARFDYDPLTLTPLGFLSEAQSTNNFRNNTMVGFVAGTPGTIPAAWSNTSTTVDSVVRTVVGTGTEDGIEFVDLRYAGTPSVNGAVAIWPESNIQVAALAGQTWTGSFYVKKLAGNWPATNVDLELRGYNGSSATETTSVNFTPTGASLKIQRFSATRALNNASTINVIARLVIAYALGVPIDFTIRVGLPQLENSGVGATSPIRTSGAAATRSQDFLTIPLSAVPGWSGSQGGVVASAYRIYSYPTGGASTQIVLITDDGVNRIQTSATNGNLLTPNLTVLSGGVTQAQIYGGTTPAILSRGILASGWSVPRSTIYASGALIGAVATATVLPVNLTLLRFAHASTQSLNGTLESVAYYRGARLDAFIQAVSR